MRGRVRDWLDELDDESALDDGLRLGGGLGLEAGLKPGAASGPTGGLTLSLAFWRSSWSLFLSISSIARKPALTCSSSESKSVFIGWAASAGFPSMRSGVAFGVRLLVRCRSGFLPIAAISAACFIFYRVVFCFFRLGGRGCRSPFMSRLWRMFGGCSEDWECRTPPIWQTCHVPD